MRSQQAVCFPDNFKTQTVSEMEQNKLMGGCEMTIYEILSLAINIAILILTLLSYLKK